MDWTACRQFLLDFARDERGGESLEYAVTSVIAVATAAATAIIAQRAMADRLSQVTDAVPDPKVRGE